MSAVFWINGGSIPAGDLLKQAGVHPHKLSQVHQLDSNPTDLDLQTSPAGRYAWSLSLPLDHAVLQHVCTSLITADADMLLLSQAPFTALLANPKAVGRANLNPRAQIAAQFSHAPLPAPDPWLAQIAARLAVFELEAADIHFLAAGDTAPADQSTFAGATWLPGPAGVLARLTALVHKLEQQQAPAGLLLSLPPGGPWLATLVLRL